MAGVSLGPHVVSGEADESDDEEVPAPIRRENSASSNPGTLNSTGTNVVVSGEASESEDELSEKSIEPADRTDDIPPLQVVGRPSGSEPAARADQPRKRIKPRSHNPKYDSLLHQKLREKNASFHNNLQERVGQLYLSSAKELSSISAQLSKSQSAVQDISHNLRILTNDLFHVEDKIDIVTSCNILPNINIEVPVHSPASRISPSR